MAVRGERSSLHHDGALVVPGAARPGARGLRLVDGPRDPEGDRRSRAARAAARAPAPTRARHPRGGRRLGVHVGADGVQPARAAARGRGQLPGSAHGLRRPLVALAVPALHDLQRHRLPRHLAVSADRVGGRRAAGARLDRDAVGAADVARARPRRGRRGRVPGLASVLHAGLARAAPGVAARRGAGVAAASLRGRARSSARRRAADGPPLRRPRRPDRERGGALLAAGAGGGDERHAARAARRRRGDGDLRARDRPPRALLRRGAAPAPPMVVPHRAAHRRRAAAPAGDRPGLRDADRPGRAVRGAADLRARSNRPSGPRDGLRSARGRSHGGRRGGDPRPRQDPRAVAHAAPLLAGVRACGDASEPGATDSGDSCARSPRRAGGRRPRRRRVHDTRHVRRVRRRAHPLVRGGARGHAIRSLRAA